MPSGMAQSQFLGIIVGGALLFVFIGLLIAYSVYQYMLTSRFLRQWEKEFRENRLVTNPLYEKLSTERYNPLFVKSQTGTP
jgi:biopolymer transport protein ExbB/TolQ